MNKIIFTASLLAVCISGAVQAAPAPVSDATGTQVSTVKLGGGGTGDRLAQLERMAEASSQWQFQVQQQLNLMQTEMRELRGMLETQGYKLQQLEKRQQEIYSEIDALSASGGAHSASSQPVTPAAPAPAATPVESNVVADSPAPQEQTPAAPAAQGEEALYNQAVELVQARNYEQALPMFQQFLTQYPNSSFADNAHYWTGQLLYQQGDRQAAQQSFITVANNYPQSPKRADALLKAGVIAEYLGSSQEALNYYQQVLTEYPSSASANLAKQRLDAIGNQ